MSKHRNYFSPPVGLAHLLKKLFMHAGKSRYQDTLTFIQKITKVCTIAPVEPKDLAVALQHNSGNMPILFQA